MLIFSTPKPFSLHTEAVQITAIRSWRKVLPSARIFLFGNDKKLRIICKAEGVNYGGSIETNRDGFEKVSDIFQKAVKNAKDEDLLYLNSDILLDETIRPIARLAGKTTGPYLATARRRCIPAWRGPPLSGPAIENFLKDKQKKFRWGQACSLDIFLFRGLSFREMPSFCIGQAAWDNWLIYHTRCQGIPVIDLSAELRPFHCDHDYSYSRDNPDPQTRSQKRDQENLDLLGEAARKFHMGHCGFEVRRGRIMRRRGFAYWLRELEFLRIYQPKIFFWIQPLRVVFRPLFRLWEKHASRKEDWNCETPTYASSL